MKGRGQVRAVLLTALITILLFSCAAGVLTACDEAKKYHAEFYDDVEGFMNDEFLKENRVGQAFYPADDFSGGQEYIKDETSPSARTFIVTNKEEYVQIFDEFPEKKK